MSPTTHPLQPEEVMAYLDGELQPERAAAAAAHIEQCAECRAIAAGLRGVSRQMTEWQIAPAPERIEEGVLAALKQRAQEPARGSVARSKEKSHWWRALRMRHLVWGLSAATVILVVLSMTTGNALLRSRRSAMTDTVSIGERKTDNSPYAQRRENQSPSSPNLLRSPTAGMPSSVPPETRDEMSGGTEADKLVASTTLAREQKMSTLAHGTSTSPMIARTAALSIETREFDNARAAMEKILRDHQGYVAQLTVTTPPGAARLLTVTLQVPAGQLNAVLAALKTLGKVQSENQTAEEVTRQYVDLTARLHNARETEARLINVLRERTGKVADVLEVEQEIARVRGEIERMDAQRKNMESSVQFSSINLRLSEEYKAVLDDATPSTGVRLRNAVVEGFLVAYELVVGVLVVVLSASPSLLLCVAVLFWPVRFAFRKLRGMLARAA